MELIERIENIIANPEGKSFESENINPTFYWAYRTAKSTGNELIDFHDVIWERDIPQIVSNLREFGITEFTLSCSFSGLINTIAEFAKLGCTIDGMTSVKADYKDFSTGEAEILNAIKLKIN